MLSKLMSLMMVFLSLSQASLGHAVEQTGIGGTLFLVNRDYPLSRDYEPSDLVTPDVLCAYQGITLRAEAAKALEQLFQAAEDEEGYRLMAISGYRSYGRQQAIYGRKIERTGSAKKAQLLVAPPGTSEHQLGLAMDVGRKSKQNLHFSFGDSKEGKWLAENAHRFGFIIRYLKEWTEITGYAYEPWHIRYVGVEHAKRIYELNIPLETYVQALFEAKMKMLMGEEAS